MSRALTIADLVPAPVEPRVRDLDLARRLGFEHEHDIRKLIRRNMAELIRYGEVSSHHGKKPPKGSRGGRPEEGFLLNEAQALLICMFSRTERAEEVRTQVIKVYLAWRRGELERGLPDPRAAELTQARAHHANLASRWADEVARRQAALNEFDRQRMNGAKVTDAVHAAAEHAGVSAGTIWNWRNAVRMVATPDRPAALAPQYKGTARFAQCHPKVLEAIVAELLRPRRPSFSDCYRRISQTAIENGWTPFPSERAVRRRIDALRKAPALNFETRVVT